MKRREGGGLHLSRDIKHREEGERHKGTRSNREDKERKIRKKKRPVTLPEGRVNRTKCAGEGLWENAEYTKNHHQRQ